MTMNAVLVFIPMPGMGHFLSMVNVAKLLMDLNSNLSSAVLFNNLKSNPTVSAEFDSIIATTASARIKFINLPPPPFDKDVPLFKSLANFGRSQKPSIVEAVTNIVRSVPGSPQLAGFVLDMFFAPLNNDLADEFCVPSYLFYTSGAADLGLKFYLQALYDEQKLNLAELKQDSEIEFNVPSFINPVSTKVFPSGLLEPDSFEMFHHKMAKHFREVKGIMVNTFSELEPHAVGSLSDGIGKLPPIYPVGPVLNLKSSSEVDQKYAVIMEWLDGQPASSVVFLCFGSMGSFDEDQVKEIACALEQSGHRFLWSLRRPPVKKASPTDYENLGDVLPQGFLDRTLGIGKIIGWAPQVAILGHSAIGGFVSHCGWNSILESIWFGVPIATWPLYSEQQLNAFEIVKELGIGVEITMDYRIQIFPKGGDDKEPEIVNAMKIERGIRCLMEQNSEVRKRVKEMSEKSRKALMEGGSSYSNFCRFINDVMENML